ncbi:hypothetical protein B296_00048610 [Ensete ventricosum]|uniref:Transcription repressor n=1 Tax=Ensete ventricosum TaxID=4639 RepID=A0A426XWN9_ENSVE|nr:hypothetical protein B296_00048610 [Ensete ventricosum]
MSTSVQQKGRRSSSFLALGCVCTDSTSVSVSSSFGSRSNMTLRSARSIKELSSADTLTMTSASSSSSYAEHPEPKTESSASTPSFSDLLRQFNAIDDKREERMRNWRSSSRGGKRVEESVVVVKETVDPLGEFRRSMLHMIVEKEIMEGAELRALLRRFLALNSPRHHGMILRAFAEIWEEVFSGCDRTPDLLLRRTRSRLPPRLHF